MSVPRAFLCHELRNPLHATCAMIDDLAPSTDAPELHTLRSSVSMMRNILVSNHISAVTHFTRPRAQHMYGGLGMDDITGRCIGYVENRSRSTPYGDSTIFITCFGIIISP
jgi:hypothetical protein